MYCKKCGKPLHMGDRFCSSCGTKVEEEFVPAFRQPKQTVQESEEKKARKSFTIPDFNWDLDGYPTDQKKTEAIDFNWDSVLEEKQRSLFEEHRRREEPREVSSEEADSGRIRDAAALMETLQGFGADSGSAAAETAEPSETAEAAAGTYDRGVYGGETDGTSGSAAGGIEELEKAIFADMGALNREDTGTFTAGEGKTAKIDRFYTFNKKNEEFQALLDREYERIRNGRTEEESEFDSKPKKDPIFEDKKPAGRTSARHEEFDWTLPGDRIFAEPPQMQVQTEAPVRELSYVGVVLSGTPLGYMAPENRGGSAAFDASTDFGEAAFAAEAAARTQRISLKQEKAAEDSVQAGQAAQEKSAGQQGAAQPAGTEGSYAKAGGDKKEEEPCGAEPFRKEAAEETDGADEQNKQRLTFDDVFGDDDDSKKPEKKGTALKVIAVLLCILLAAEGVMIGIQKFAPESAAAQTINKMYSRIFSLFDKDKEEGEEQEPAAEAGIEEESEIADFIEPAKKLGKNIASVEENSALVFEDGEDYGFDDFANAYTFTNKPWYTDDDGNSVTYGQEIVSTVVQFYSAWVDKMNGKNEKILDFADDTTDLYTELESLSGEEDVRYGIDKLQIGEVRAGSAGFYVYVSVTKADSSTSKSVTKQQVVYMEPVSKAMKIVDIKEI